MGLSLAARFRGDAVVGGELTVMVDVTASAPTTLRAIVVELNGFVDGRVDRRVLHVHAFAGRHVALPGLSTFTLTVPLPANVTPTFTLGPLHSTTLLRVRVTRSLGRSSTTTLPIVIGVAPPAHLTPVELRLLDGNATVEVGSSQLMLGKPLAIDLHLRTPGPVAWTISGQLVPRSNASWRVAPVDVLELRALPPGQRTLRTHGRVPHTLAPTCASPVLQLDWLLRLVVWAPRPAGDAAGEMGAITVDIPVTVHGRASAYTPPIAYRPLVAHRRAAFAAVAAQRGWALLDDDGADGENITMLRCHPAGVLRLRWFANRAGERAEAAIAVLGLGPGVDIAVDIAGLVITPPGQRAIAWRRFSTSPNHLRQRAIAPSKHLRTDDGPCIHVQLDLDLSGDHLERNVYELVDLADELERVRATRAAETALVAPHGWRALADELGSDLRAADLAIAGHVGGYTAEVSVVWDNDQLPHVRVRVGGHDDVASQVRVVALHLTRPAVQAASPRIDMPDVLRPLIATLPPAVDLLHVVDGTITATYRLRGSDRPLADASATRTLVHALVAMLDALAPAHVPFR